MKRNPVLDFAEFYAKKVSDSGTSGTRLAVRPEEPRPVMRKCGPVIPDVDSLEEKLAAKAKFRELRQAAGLGVRETGRVLRVDESTVRAWEDPGQLKKHPPAWAARAVSKRARAVGDSSDDLPLTGTRS